jgi:D-arabinose 1-dehydrogenase-like Zn-dependent alcohol dehydrogenase
LASWASGSFPPNTKTPQINADQNSGLGHLAVQFAAKLGCEVVVFSLTDSKKDDALKLGAKLFISTKDKSTLEVARLIDHLLVTTNVLPDWNLLLPIMAAEASVYPLSVRA